MTGEISRDTGQPADVADGARFEFGKNWKSFLRTVDRERIMSASNALLDMLQIDLKGKHFVDAG